MEEKISFYDRALFYIGVPRCVGCSERLGAPGAPLCPACLAKYREAIENTCPTCLRPLSECLCVPEYAERRCVRSLSKVTRYRSSDTSRAENRLIYSLKQDHRRDTVRFLAAEMERSVRAGGIGPRELVLTNVPRRAEAIRRYGYDHSASLAKALARRLRVPYLRTLRSEVRTAQKGLTVEQRRENTAFSLAVPREKIAGARFLIVDDIVTTGTSLACAASVLHDAGAAEIRAASFAIAYRG